MREVRVSIEALRLSLSGISPETARLAVDGLGPELELRLAARLGSSPAFGMGLEARGRGPAGIANAGASRGAARGDGTRALGVVDAKTTLDAAGLRALIAERLLAALEDPAAPHHPGGTSGAGS